MLNRYEAYELPVEGDNEVQGMIALKHIRNQYYTHSGRRNNMIIAERKMLVLNGLPRILIVL